MAIGEVVSRLNVLELHPHPLPPLSKVLFHPSLWHLPTIGLKHVMLLGLYALHTCCSNPDEQVSLWANCLRGTFLVISIFFTFRRLGGCYYRQFQPFQQFWRLSAFATLVCVEMFATLVCFVGLGSCHCLQFSYDSAVLAVRKALPNCEKMPTTHGGLAAWTVHRICFGRVDGPQCFASVVLMVHCVSLQPF